MNDLELPRGVVTIDMDVAISGIGKTEPDMADIGGIFA